MKRVSMASFTLYFGSHATRPECGLPAINCTRAANHCRTLKRNPSEPASKQRPPIHHQVVIGDPRGRYTSAQRTFSQSLYRQEHRSAFVLHKEHQEFCWLGTAGIPPDNMHVVGPLVERLSRGQRHLLPALYLHHNGTLEDVNESMRIVAVDWIGIAGGIFHDEHHSLFARALLKILRQDGRDL